MHINHMILQPAKYALLALVPWLLVPFIKASSRESGMSFDPD